jgi:hypothetical protein
MSEPRMAVLTVSICRFLPEHLAGRLETVATRQSQLKVDSETEDPES